MDPRIDFISSVESKSTRVKSFRGFIFLCGGPHDIRAGAQSLRSLIIREMSSGGHPGLADRIKLAEEIQDWFRDEAYSDLVSLEEHLASLSSLIVLVVESRGAIAELGVFSTVTRFSDRMLTLVANVHYEQDSFIRLGPVQRLENIADDRVLIYDWIALDDRGREIMRLDDLDADVVEVVKKISEILSVPLSEAILKKDDPLHIMLMICELCDLFGALLITEIETYLTTLGFEISSKELKQYAFLLTHCQMLGVKKKGHAKYHYSIKWDSHISFALGGKPIDRIRLQVDTVEYYKTHDPRRASVIRWVRSNVG